MKNMTRVSAIMVAVTLAGVGAQAEPRDKEKYGIVTGCHEAEPTVGDLTRDIGVGWVRVACAWEQVQPSQGTFDFHLADIAVDQARSRGLKVYWDFPGPTSENLGVPGWANGGQDGRHGPTNAGDLRAYVAAVVGHFKNRTYKPNAYGTWNEPNLAKFYIGAGCGASPVGCNVSR